MPERGRVPGSKDINSDCCCSESDCMVTTHGATSGRPMQPNRVREFATGKVAQTYDDNVREAPLSRTQNSPVAANMADPAIEDQSAPSVSGYGSVHSTSGASRLDGAERGTGRRG